MYCVNERYFKCFFYVTVQSIIRETVENNGFLRFELGMGAKQNVSKSHRCSIEKGQI